MPYTPKNLEEIAEQIGDIFKHTDDAAFILPQILSHLNPLVYETVSFILPKLSLEEQAIIEDISFSIFQERYFPYIKPVTKEECALSRKAFFEKTFIAFQQKINDAFFREHGEVDTDIISDYNNHLGHISAEEYFDACNNIINPETTDKNKRKILEAIFFSQNIEQAKDLFLDLDIKLKFYILQAFVASNCLDGVEFILSNIRKADTLSGQVVNKDIAYALEQAVCYGYIDIVNFLLKKVGPFSHYVHGHLLIKAGEHKHWDIVDMLLDRSSSHIDEAIKAAAASENTAFIERLLPLTTDTRRSTIFRSACENNKKEILSLFSEEEKANFLIMEDQEKHAIIYHGPRFISRPSLPPRRSDRGRYGRR